MMIVGSYFASSSLEGALQHLGELSSGLRPTHFGTSERKPPASNRISTKEKFQRFLQKNPKGHFLFADDCLFDITMSFRSNYAKVFVYSLGGRLDDDGAREVFHLLGRAGAGFRFACQVEEYHHRNRYVTQMGENTIEAWVGRDLGKYVPGVYWLTGLAQEIVSQFGLSMLADSLSGARICVGERGDLVVELPGPSEDWKDWACALDKLCQSHPGFFSLRRLQPQLDGAVDYVALSQVLAAAG